MAEKLAIIMSGGGMKSSFGVGVLLALVEYGITSPDILICGSGSAGTGSYYLSKQYGSIRNIWTRLVSSKRFINFKRFWKIIDVDYLIDIIFKRKDPLNKEKLFKTDTLFLIPAYNKKTGNVDYLNFKKDGDIFEIMRATKSIPIAFKLNPGVKINNSIYCDSLLSSSAKSHIKRAISLGANKILLINNSINKKKNVENVLFSVWMFFQKSKKRYYLLQRELLKFNLPSNVEIFTIKPRRSLRITTLNNDKRLLERSINQGYEETLSNDGLKEFLDRNL